MPDRRGTLFAVADGADLGVGRTEQGHELANRMGTLFAQCDVVLARPALIGVSLESDQGAGVLREIARVRLDGDQTRFRHLARVECEVNRAGRQRARGIVERMSLEFARRRGSPGAGPPGAGSGGIGDGPSAA